MYVAKLLRNRFDLSHHVAGQYHSAKAASLKPCPHKLYNAFCMIRCTQQTLGISIQTQGRLLSKSWSKVDLVLHNLQ